MYLPHQINNFEITDGLNELYLTCIGSLKQKRPNEVEHSTSNKAVRTEISKQLSLDYKFSVLGSVNICPIISSTMILFFIYYIGIDFLRCILLYVIWQRSTRSQRYTCRDMVCLMVWDLLYVPSATSYLILLTKIELFWLVCLLYLWLFYLFI